jgi:hypothetical protein
MHGKRKTGTEGLVPRYMGITGQLGKLLTKINNEGWEIVQVIKNVDRENLDDFTIIVDKYKR